MRADEVRRRLHGTQTTFVRVAEVPADPQGSLTFPSAAGEIRIVGVPASRSAAVERVRDVAARERRARVRVFAERSRAARGADGVTLRALLEELRAAGLELVAEAPFDRLQDAAAVRRRDQHRRPRACALDHSSAAVLRHRVAPEARRRSPAGGRRRARVRAAAARRQPGGADDRVRRCEAGGAGAPHRRERAVDSGGLGVVRAEARAGRAHRRRRRRRRRVGAGRHERRSAGARRSKRSAGTSARPARIPWSATAGSTPAPLRTSAPGDPVESIEPRPPGRRRLSQRAAARVRSRSIAALRGAVRPSVAMRGAPPRRRDRRRPDPVDRVSARPGGRGHSIVPGLAIASRGPVASVALYTKRPIADVRSIAMDTSSRTSVALVRVLCARLFRIQPSIEARGPDLNEMLEHCDAALIIGDNALLVDSEPRRASRRSTWASCGRR